MEGTPVAAAARVGVFELTLMEDRTKSLANDPMGGNELKPSS